MNDPAITQGLGTLDFTVMGAYLVLVFILGALFAKQQHTTKDFFLAGRSMGWLPVGISLVATIFSAISFISVPSVVAKYGIILFVGSCWVTLVLIPVVTKVFIPFYCRLKVYSGYEYLERRFGVGVRCMASGMFIVWRICWMALALYVPCLALQAALGSDSMTLLYTLIICLGLLATIYTVLGGMKAVIWTDVAQFCVLFGGMLFAILYISTHVSGGFSGVWAFAKANGHTKLTAAIAAPPAFESFWEWVKWYFRLPITLPAIIAGTVFPQLGFFSVDQVMLQRYLSAKDELTAKRSFVANAIGIFVLGLVLTTLGMHLYAFYGGQVPEALAEAGSGWDKVLPYFAATEIWPGIAGLIIAALFAATMSSVDSGINSVSTAFLVDFYARIIKGQRFPSENEGDVAEEKRQLVLARILTLFFGILATILACFVKEMGDNIIDITNKIVNNFAGPMLGIFLLGIFSRRASSLGMIIGPIVGVGTAFVLTAPMKKFGCDWEIGVAGWWAAAIGLAVTLVLGYGISLLTNLFTGNPSDEKLAGVTWARRDEEAN